MKLCFWNNEQICSSENEYDTKLPGAEWRDAPVDFDVSKVYKLEDNIIVEQALATYAPDRLRVHRVLHISQNALISDFSILGFRKLSPSYLLGKKTKSEYRCTASEDVIVEKLFTDLRDTEGVLIGLQVTFNWYSETNNIEASKTEIVKSYNKFEAETEERKRRGRQMDYLRASVAGTALEVYVETLLHHYKDEQSEYILNGTSVFADAINAEADAAILPILAIEVPRNDDPSVNISVKNSILYQLGAYTL